MMMGHCCHCGLDGEQINFRVYDFDDGVWLWERRLPFPMVATDGKVYAKLFASVADFGREWSSLSSMIAISHHNDATNAAPVYSMAWERYAAADGSVLGASPLLDYVTPAGGEPDYDERGLVSASRFAVNNAGLVGWGSTSPHPASIVVEHGNATATATYYLRPTRSSSGTITLRCGTLSTALTGGTTATVNANSTAAAAQTAIATGFGSNATSVTATSAGANLTEAAIKVVITWAHADYYLDGIQKNIGAWVPLPGGYLQNLQTGAITTNSGEPVSASYTATCIWASDNSTLLKQTANPANATIKIVQAFTAGGTPWTRVWSAGLPAGGLLNPYASTTDQNIQSLSADNDRVVIGHQARYNSGAATPGGAANNAGTNILTLFGGEPTATAIGGSWVQRSAVQDGGTEIVVHNQQWAGYQSWNEHSGDAEYPASGRDVYGAWRADSIQEVTGSSRAAMSGQAESWPAIYGFDTDRLAVIGFPRSEVDDAIVTRGVSRELVDWLEVDVASTPGGLPPEHNLVIYYLHSPEHFSLADCEWRIEWPDENYFTEWLADTATLAQVNAALVTLAGTDDYGTPNAVASLSGFTIDSNTPRMAWQEAMRIDVISAKSYQTPSDHGWVDEFQGMGAWNLILPLVIRVRSAVSHRPGTTVAALNWASGAFDWSRLFHSTVGRDLARGPRDATLKAGELYVHGLSSARTIYEEVASEYAAYGFTAAGGADSVVFGRLGTTASTEIDNWLRFPAWRFEIVDEAILRLPVTAVTGDSATYTVYAVDAASHTTPNDHSTINALAKTTASAALDVSGATVSAILELDVTVLIREAMDSAGWTPGTSDLGLVLIASSTVDNEAVTCQDVTIQVKGQLA